MGKGHHVKIVTVGPFEVVPEFRRKVDSLVLVIIGTAHRGVVEENLFASA
jgi:hypothetical protein